MKNLESTIDVDSPPSKKMKQTRLSFQTTSTKAKSPEEMKRKISTESLKKNEDSGDIVVLSGEESVKSCGDVKSKKNDDFSEIECKEPATDVEESNNTQPQKIKFPGDSAASPNDVKNPKTTDKSHSNKKKIPADSKQINEVEDSIENATQKLNSPSSNATSPKEVKNPKTTNKSRSNTKKIPSEDSKKIDGIDEDSMENGSQKPRSLSSNAASPKEVKNPKKTDISHSNKKFPSEDPKKIHEIEEDSMENASQKLISPNGNADSSKDVKNSKTTDELENECDTSTVEVVVLSDDENMETTIDDEKADFSKCDSSESECKAETEVTDVKSRSELKKSLSLIDKVTSPRNKSQSEAIIPKTPTDKGSNPNSSLTPKQLQKKLEAAKKKEEKEQERVEKEQKRQEEKEERARQKQEKEDQKRKEKEEKEELRRKEKEEKDEVKRKEKEEKERIKEKEKKEREEKEEMKRKEKEAKDEEKRKKQETIDEEKRKKEIEKEEAEQKKKKAAEAFANFFVPKQRSEGSSDCRIIQNHGYLSSFTVKVDMRMAPRVRRKLEAVEMKLFDDIFPTIDQESDHLYLARLKSDAYKPRSSGSTWPVEEIKDDVIIIEDDDLPMIEGAGIVIEESKREKLHPKLLSFCENRRPPYWGTWRKKNKNITGRRPFGKDEKVFDYECDSDDEWEEEEPGESVGGSVAASDEENEVDEYEVDNEFFVPHGYLSDEEVGEDDLISMSPEAQKAKLKYLGDEFENDLKKPTERLKPRLFGIVWESTDCSKPVHLAEAVWAYFGKMEMLTFETPINLKPVIEGKDLDDECENAAGKSTSKKLHSITAAMIPDLVKLLHGNTNNRMFLAKEFQSFVCKSVNANLGIENGMIEASESQKVSKLSIKRKVRELSKWMMCPDEGPMCGKYCWYVDNDTRKKYELSELKIPNDWTYILEPTSRSDNVKRKVPKLSEENSKLKRKSRTPMEKSGQKEKKKPTHGLDIKKFARKLTYDQTAKTTNENTSNIEKTNEIITIDLIEDAKENLISNRIVPEDIKENKSEKSEEKEVKVEIKENTVKKRVALLFSGPRGCDIPSIVKPTNSVIDEMKSKDKSESPPIEKKSVSLLASGPVGKPLKSNVEVTPESKKKRVSILASGPLGKPLIPVGEPMPDSPKLALTADSPKIASILVSTTDDTKVISKSKKQVHFDDKLESSTASVKIVEEKKNTSPQSDIKNSKEPHTASPKVVSNIKVSLGECFGSIDKKISLGEAQKRKKIVATESEDSGDKETMTPIAKRKRDDTTSPQLSTTSPKVVSNVKASLDECFVSIDKIGEAPKLKKIVATESEDSGDKETTMPKAKRKRDDTTSPQLRITSPKVVSNVKVSLDECFDSIDKIGEAHKLKKIVATDIEDSEDKERTTPKAKRKRDDTTSPQLRTTSPKAASNVRVSLDECFDPIDKKVCTGEAQKLKKFVATESEVSGDKETTTPKAKRKRDDTTSPQLRTTSSKVMSNVKVSLDECFVSIDKKISVGEAQKLKKIVATESEDSGDKETTTPKAKRKRDDTTDSLKLKNAKKAANAVGKSPSQGKMTSILSHFKKVEKEEKSDKITVDDDVVVID